MPLFNLDLNSLTSGNSKTVKVKGKVKVKVKVNVKVKVKVYACPVQRLWFFVQPGLNGQVCEYTLPFIITSPTVQPGLNAKCKTMDMRVRPYVISRQSIIIVVCGLSSLDFL